MMKKRFVVGKVVFDDRLYILREELSNLIFFGVYFVFDGFDTIFFLFGFILDVLLHAVHELVDSVCHGELCY